MIRKDLCLKTPGNIMICSCPKTGGNGIGICKACGGETCTWHGCFISDPKHECNKPQFLRWC